MAALELATRTRTIRYMINKVNISPICRPSGDREQPVARMVSECKVLAQNLI